MTPNQGAASLVERLRTHADDCERLSMPEGRPALSLEVASTLSALEAENAASMQTIADERDRADRAEAENARLRGALEPFAAMAAAEPENAEATWRSPAEHFRVALRALNPIPEVGG